LKKKDDMLTNRCSLIDWNSENDDNLTNGRVIGYLVLFQYLCFGLFLYVGHESTSIEYSVSGQGLYFMSNFVSISPFFFCFFFLL